eukprot:scaffold304896_cov24-Attheya_sp.AAC.1
MDHPRLRIVSRSIFCLGVNEYAYSLTLEAIGLLLEWEWRETTAQSSKGGACHHGVDHGRRSKEHFSKSTNC